MGVSGSGKSTIGKMLAGELHIPFFDGDDYHSKENVSKMQAGIPLDDSDRYVWLKKLNAIAQGYAKQNGCVIACSALKEAYRKILTEGLGHQAKWILLKGEYELIRERMKERTSHFMPIELLASQFDTLEIPSYSMKISIDTTPELIVQHILHELEY